MDGLLQKYLVAFWKLRIDRAHGSANQFLPKASTEPVKTGSSWEEARNGFSSG
jgi:hypothetical protein